MPRRNDNTRTTAERAYAFRKGDNYETYEEREWRFTQVHNKIFELIEKAENASDYIKIVNQINVFKTESGRISDANRLVNKLKKHMEQIQDELQEQMTVINSRIDEIKANMFSENIETVKEIQTKSDMFLLEVLTKLRTDDVYNRRFLGSIVANANREQAIALLKLSQMEQYKRVLSDKQKETCIEKSKSKAEIVFETNKQKQIEELGSELGKVYMHAFQLRQATKKISSSDNTKFTHF